MRREVVIPAPELRGGALALMGNRDLEVCLDGPAGTGKTFVALYKVHLVLSAYPGAKALVARKSNTALSGSAMATFRESVLDPREGVRFFGGNQIKPAAFEYPNGSLMTMNGLDKPEKVKSWEFDLAYINEASECTLEDIEMVRSRLRHDKTPYRQLIMDVNPGPPTHWLNRRMIAGLTTRLLSRHKDNPRFYDLKTQSYTADGIAYIEGVLGGLTGVRKLRLRDGIWAAAEGMVYEEWDTATHIVSRQQLTDWGILSEDETLNRAVVKSVFASVDWGFTNPGVIQVWALDGDGRMYLLREVYRTQRTIDWWIEQAQQLDREFGIELFVCDPSEPAYIQQFNDAGLRAEAATNAIAPGISAVHSRLKVAGDGRPRLVIYEYSLIERDELREAVEQPCCLPEEIDGYVYPKSKDGYPVKEVPVKINDHSCDCLRYMCMHLTQHSPEGGLVLLGQFGDEGVESPFW